MAPTFPLAMPDLPFSAVDFDLVRYVAQNQLGGSVTQSVEYADPRWRGKYATDPLNSQSPHDLAEIGQWEAFWDLLQGGKRFLAFDPAHRYPSAYPQGLGLGGWTFGNVSSIPSAFTLSFTSLLSGLQLRAGDHVGLVQSGRYSLHRIVEDRTAIGTSLSNVFVEPFINTNLFSSLATPFFVKALCEMVPVSGSFSAPKRTSAAAVTFEGIQVLY